MLTQLSAIVTDVGHLLLDWRSQGILQAFWDSPHKCKARVDALAHEELFGRLNALNPRLPIISEEDTDSHVSGRPSRYWLIDPLDGTASYIKGYDGFVTQVALMVDDKPQLAAVYAPVFDQLYTAERGHYAFLNHRMLFVNQRPATTLIDSFPKMTGAVLSAYEHLRLARYVECGGISLKVCRVASGSADVFFKKVVVWNWDVAAPQLVLEEAGGVFTDGWGLPVTYRGNYWVSGLVATNTRATHDRYMEWHTQYYRLQEEVKHE